MQKCELIYLYMAIPLDDPADFSHTCVCGCQHELQFECHFLGLYVCMFALIVYVLREKKNTNRMKCGNLNVSNFRNDY